MDSTESLVLLVVVPIVAWAAAVLLLRGRYQDVQREWMSRGQTPSSQRLLVVSAYGAVPFLLGLSMWFLSLDFADVLGSGTSPADLSAADLFFWAELAYAAAACCTVAGQTIVVRGRLSSLLGTDFGRVLPISVIPFTDSVFAMVLVFLSFNYVHGVAAGGLPAGTAAVSSAIAAFQGYAVASLAMPVAAAVSNRIQDLSKRGFSRALMVMEVGELPILLGLILGFLAMTGLVAA